MPDPKNNTPGQRGAPKTILDDYLPDYSPRPKYVIATIYPPASEPLAVPDREVPDRSGHSGQLNTTPETDSGCLDPGLPVRTESGILGTGWRESSLGRASPQTARSGSESAGLMNPAGALGTISHLSEPSRPVAGPSGRELSRIELPRGKFHSLERNISIISLLHHLHARGFRGTCRINRGGSKILLVFDQGRIILAEYNSLMGDAALGMICTHRFEQVDALISELDDVQIRLSLEFNPSWKVRGNPEPSWVVSPGTTELTEIPFGKEAPGTEHSLLEFPGSGREAVLPETGGPFDERGELAQEQGTAGDPLERPEESDDRSGMPVYGETEKQDWKKALSLPLCPPEDEPVLPPRPGPDGIQPRGGEVDRRSALATPLVSPDPREVPAVPVPERRGAESELVEGWKKALYMPVESAQAESTDPVGRPGRERRLSVPVIPDFELLSADSGLFDDIPVKRKVRRASGPEPAEQWRSMGSNRGENSSV